MPQETELYGSSAYITGGRKPSQPPPPQYSASEIGGYAHTNGGAGKPLPPNPTQHPSQQGAYPYGMEKQVPAVYVHELPDRAEQVVEIGEAEPAGLGGGQSVRGASFNSHHSRGAVSPCSAPSPMREGGMF